MKKTTPLVITVTVLCAVLLALVMFWVALLPGRLTSALTQDLERRTGLAAKVNESSLGVFSGLSLELDDVSLSDVATTATVDRIRAGLSWRNILGSKLRLESLNLESPVITIKTDASVVPPSAEEPADLQSNDKPSKALAVTIHNGTLKWSDLKRQSSIAVSDINGTVKTDDDGSAAVELAGLFNGKLTRLSATLNDIQRLKSDGTPSDVTLTSGHNSLSFSGRIRMRGGMQMDGRATAEAENLHDLVAWAGLPLSGFSASGTTRAESSVSWNGARLELKDLAVALGPSNVKGTLSLGLSGERPNLEATLSADVLDLGTYARSETAPSPSPSIAAPWNEEQVSFGDLRMLDAKIVGSAEKLIVAGLQAQKATLDLQLTSGKLALSLASDNVAGGKATAELQLQHGDKQPDLALKLDATNVGARAFLQPLTGFAAIDGPLTLHADLQSQGDSTARLISSAAGTVDLTLKDGRIDGLALASFLSGKGRGWHLQTDAMTLITTGHAAFSLQDGIAQATDLSVQSNGLKVTAEGEIDLLRQNLDLVCRPVIGGDIKLPVQVAVSGPWTDPTVDPDIDPSKLKPKALLKSGKKAIKKLFGN